MKDNPQHYLDSISLGKIVQIRELIMQQQAAGRKVYRFESGDPNFSIPQHVVRAITDAAHQGHTHYVPNNGTPDFRKALAKKVQEKNKIPIHGFQNIFLTNGAMHGLFVTYQCLLDKGDEVIVPDPMWTEAVENVRCAGGIPVPVELRVENDFAYVPRDIETKISEKTKAIFLNTPQNPTGAMLDREVLLEIIEIAKKNKLFIISDEAYEDVVFEPHTHISVASLAEDYLDHIITLYSFSKSYAMSGLRLGYVVTSNEKIMERLPKILRCTINGVNSVGQRAGLAAVTGDQSQIPEMNEEYIKRREAFYNALKDIPGLKPFFPKGGFFIWAEIEQSLYHRLELRDADELSTYLAANGVGSAPGDAFGVYCKDAIRFSFSCSTEMVKEGAEILRQLLLNRKK